MPTTRVVLLDLPLMLRELLMLNLSRRADVEVVELDEAGLGFDLAVVALADGELDASGRRLLARVARPRLLGLEDAGRQGYLYELHPHRDSLGEFSDAVLAEVLAALGGAP